MRLQLTRRGLLRTVVAGATLACAPALASEGSGTSVSGRVATRVDVYSDEWITVVAPAMEASVEPRGGKVRVDGGFTVDVVSGATQVLIADTVSSATQFSDVRKEASLAVTVRPRTEVSVRGGYTASLENDYETHAGAVSLSADLFQRMTTASVGYGLSVENAGLASGEPLEERTIRHSLDLGWTFILGRRTSMTVLGSGGYSTCGEVFGCEPGPYRYVPLMEGDFVVASVRERHPDQLGRGAVAVRLSQGLPGGLAVHGGYRFYGDTWAVTGHTADASLAAGLLGERLILEARGRFTRQGPASFYLERYETTIADPAAPEYRSIDRELSGMTSAQAGGRVEWAFVGAAPFLRLGVSVRLDHTWYWYPRFPALPRRGAWMVSGGVEAEF